MSDAEFHELDHHADLAEPFRLDGPRKAGSLVFVNSTDAPSDGERHRLAVVRQDGAEVRSVGSVSYNYQTGPAGMMLLVTQMSLSVDISDADADATATLLTDLAREAGARFELKPRVRSFATAVPELAEAFERRIDLFRWSGSFDGETNEYLEEMLAELSELGTQFEEIGDDPTELHDAVQTLISLYGAEVATVLGIEAGLTVDQLVSNLDQARVTITDRLGGDLWVFATMSRVDLEDAVLAWSDEHFPDDGIDDGEMRDEARRLLGEVFG